MEWEVVLRPATLALPIRQTLPGICSRVDDVQYETDGLPVCKNGSQKGMWSGMRCAFRREGAMVWCRC